MESFTKSVNTLKHIPEPDYIVACIAGLHGHAIKNKTVTIHSIY